MKEEKFYLQKDEHYCCFWKPLDLGEPLRYKEYCFIRKNNRWVHLSHVIDSRVLTRDLARKKYCELLNRGYKPVESIEQAVENLNHTCNRK
jgi:hypothetical protein